jgi:hypothetical protein
MRKILILSASVLALAACGKSDETKVTVTNSDGTTTEAKVSSDGETTIVKAAEGELKIQQGGSANFPAFAPQYPGSNITATMTASSDGNKAGNGNMISQQTSDTPAEVMAFYKQKLVGAKMPIQMETTTPQGGMIAAGTEGENSGVMITVGEADGKTTITMISGVGN